MGQFIRCASGERPRDEITDALDFVRLDLNVAATRDRQYGAANRTKVERRLVRHVLAKPPSGKSAFDVQNVTFARLQRPPNLRLPPQEAPRREPLQPAERVRHPLRLDSHHLGARHASRGQQDHTGDPLVPRREPDRDRRADRVSDNAHSRRIDPERIANDEKRGRRVLGLPVEARREVVAVRLADASLVESERRHASRGEAVGEGRGDVEPLTAHVRVSVERTGPVEQERSCRVVAGVRERHRPHQAHSVVGRQLERAARGSHGP